jgi:hypothetical protein
LKERANFETSRKWPAAFRREEKIVAAAGMLGEAVTIFKNITKGRSVVNFFVGLKLAKFEEGLARSSGKALELTKDGKAKRLLHNGLKYVSRAFSNSGPSTIEFWRDGKLLQKYRLLQ